jgi:hypothetical protein
MKLQTILRTLACMAVLLGCNSGGHQPPAMPSGGSAGQAGEGGSAGQAGEAGRGGGGPSEPIAPVDMSAQALSFNALQEEATAAVALDAEGALAQYTTTFRSELSYDPSASVGLDTIQGSALALSEGELAKLGEQGFVISSRREFPTFLRGLAEIYSEHLPLYVSADAILESVHSSYDTILLSIERAILVPELGRLLEGMHGRIASSDAAPQAKAHAELYIAVARGLLEGEAPALVEGIGTDGAQVDALIAKANAAQGIELVDLFGVKRMEDFSQFTPRGHYTGDEGDEQMPRYFRAMMWLGRVDLRIIETLSDGSQVFRPEQYAAMLLLHALIEPDAARWQTIDDAIRTFVGESDYMVVPEVAKLVADLGGVDAAKSASKEAVVAAIVAGGYGEQQIASHLMVNDGTVATLPLNRSFLVFGQRYIADSHVFSEVVFDRIGGRMMPNPLDAAFAALGNDQALALSSAELDAYPGLPGALARMRVLIDAHDESFWQSNFYNLWVDALRALSPAKDPASIEGLPEVAATEAWGRRILNAQLGSWAELRHDTLLYAKQSYSGIPGCEFPDVYVDPYPEAFGAIVKYAEQGARIVAIAQAAPAESGLATKVAAYFDTLRDVASKLTAMAEQQRRGEAFSADQMAFINDAVRVDEEEGGCTTIEIPNGWYADLFFERDKSIEFKPTIADVHTQPADEAGNIVGKVLHVGTGYPRYFVTSIDTCNGPRAYAGVVFAYHEQVTEDFERLTDEKWSERFYGTGTRPTEVPWLSSVLAE